MVLFWLLFTVVCYAFVIDDTTVFSFSPNFTSTPLQGNPGAISDIRKASSQYFEFRSKFQTDVLESDSIFLRILQLVEPFPYPLYKESAIFYFLDGKSIQEVNEQLWALQMVVEGMRKSACADNERLNLVEGDGEFECEKTEEITTNSNTENALFNIVIMMIVVFLSAVLVKQRIDIYKLNKRKIA